VTGQPVVTVAFDRLNHVVGTSPITPTGGTMRHLVRVLVAVTSLLTVNTISIWPATVGTASASGGGTAEVDSSYVQRLMFTTPISTFSADAKARVGPDGHGGDTWFDWSTDLCSAPLVGNTGRSFNFTDACRRHDFGYRNDKRLDQRYGSGRFWNSSARKRIDQQFLADMRAHCDGRRLLDRPTCRAWAYTYYNAVRIAGGP
jgi:hypothetical protein